MKTKLSEEIVRNLIASAFEARENAYAVYSHFAVGAAALSDDGGIYSGCNVENASYPAGSCAETVAINKAVSEGAKRIVAVAIVGGKTDEEQPVFKAEVQEGQAGDAANDYSGYLMRDYTYPCGICRQVIAEFKSEEGTEVIIAKSLEDYRVYDIADLLPGAFSL